MTSSSWIELDVAALLSTSIECILYGISSVLFCGTMWALTRARPQDEKINWQMALVALILMVLSTIHVVVDVQRLIFGFTTFKLYPGSAAFFADATQRTFIIKHAVYVLQTLLGDGVVIYRCFVVWQRFRVVFLPVVLWCASSAISAGLLYHASHAKHSEDIFSFEREKWNILFYVSTMTTNLLSSGLLAYRVWAMNQDQPGVVRVLSRSGVDSTLLLRVLIDAAALYTLALFALLVCCVYQNMARCIMLDMMTPIISITFYMVLVRIAIARHDFTGVPAAVLSPLRFATRTVPSPPETRHISVRRSSI